MLERFLVVLLSVLVFQQTSLAVDESYGYSRNDSFHTKLKCERFPDVKNDPLPCAKRNYKVLAINLTVQSRTQMAAHESLLGYASNISKQCLNNVSDMICKAVPPACDRNETMVVYLLSRQDCERIISCLNTTSKVKNFQDGAMGLCRSLPDAITAKRVSLSLVYTEFEDIIPKTYNDTKISTTITTQSPTPNKTDQIQSRNGTGETEGLNTPTIRPFLHLTDQNRTPATMLKSSPTTQANITKPNAKSKPATTPKSSPTAQGNITKSNAKSKPATDRPTVNATYQEKKEAKSVPNLTPTTESLLNQNYTTPDQHGTELSKTPQLNTTSSPVVRRGNATGRCVYNVSTITSHSISILVNECSNWTLVVELPDNLCNKATQLNTRMNALAFLVISFLSICMWQ